MKTKTNRLSLPVKDRIERINNLDLEPIIVKMMDPKEGQGWSLEQAFEAEKWYKRFLTLNLLHPDRTIIPNNQIDVFWHYHILDTMKYQDDCKYALGYFLHHFPYMGMRGEEDAENLSRSFDDTLNLFSSEFGESLVELSKVYFEEATCHGTNCGNSNGRTRGPSTCQPSCAVSKSAKKAAHCSHCSVIKTNLSRPTLASVN